MTIATTKDIIDAVVTDLEANVDLPSHQTFKYAKARSLRVDQGNWLMVYPAVTSADVISTRANYDNAVRISVEWATPAFAGVESNVEDQNLAAQHLLVSDRIKARLMRYADGIDDLWNVTAVLDDITYDLATGQVWEAIATLRFELFEGNN